MLGKGGENVSTDEIAKEIVVAMIENKLLGDVDEVCDAYRQIVKTVYDPSEVQQ